jgi:DNA-binding NarL/FixJ family response regulator
LIPVAYLGEEPEGNCLQTIPDIRKTRVLIVDDHPMVRDGIVASIRAQSDMEVVGEATCGQEAISLFSQTQPDVTLMDLRLPDMSGNEAIAQIRSTYPNARIIVLTTYQGDVQAIKAFKAGAMAYLLKSSLRKELLNTIRSVLNGRKVIPPEIAAAMASHVADDELSARELQILRHVADGLSNKLIADRLALSPDTVKSHLANAMAKLNANDRTHAVTIAVKRGYFDLDA